MSLKDSFRGFYAILDRDDEALAKSLFSVAPVVQIRVKNSAEERANAAKMAKVLAAASGKLLIVNDDVELAISVGANGVHLGQDDMNLSEARARVPPGFIIGLSTHNRGQVEEAIALGADYIGFGPVYKTATKQNPDPVQGVAGLREAVRAAGELPVVAIGGITAERISEVVEAGATAACCIGAVNGAEVPALAAQNIHDAFF